jgi:mannose-6-phosphate isomerase-like protein (cupin superfamily)
MSDAKIVKLAETEVVSFGPLAHYQPIIGDDEGTTPVRTGIQTSQPGYVAPVHSHPYLEILHILDGTAEAWLEGREDEKVVLGKGDTIALPPGAPHSFRVVGDVPLRLLGTHVSPTRIVNYRDGGTHGQSRLPPGVVDRRRMLFQPPARPEVRSARRMRWRSSSEMGVSGGRTYAAGMRPRSARASFMRLCMSTKGGA